MFLGQYHHTIDNKGRLTIPARFRDLLLDGAYILRGFDQNLMVLTDQAFERFSKRLGERSITELKARQFMRFIYGNIVQVEVDKAGRILIPQFLRQSAGLDSDVMVVGMGEFFEIWMPDKWSQQSVEMDAEDIAQRFSEFELPTG